MTMSRLKYRESVTEGQQHEIYVVAAIIASTLINALCRVAVRMYYARRWNPVHSVSNFTDRRARWMESFWTTLVFLVVSALIVFHSMWRAYWDGRLLDYMVNDGWTNSPEVIVGALFLGRNFCDFLMGSNNIKIVLHHIAASGVFLVLMLWHSYRLYFVGNFCLYMIAMEIGSIYFNVYVLWPCKLTRNLYFYTMLSSNISCFCWHWIADIIAPHHGAMKDPLAILMVLLGCIFNIFRQREAMLVCGFPLCLGGHGFLPVSSVTTINPEKENVCKLKKST